MKYIVDKVKIFIIITEIILDEDYNQSKSTSKKSDYKNQENKNQKYFQIMQIIIIKKLSIWN